VCGLGGIENAQKSVPQMLEDFKQHPAVRPLIEGEHCLSIPLIWYQKAVSRCCQNWWATVYWWWVMPLGCV
jgi:flavin-dependent dehydrogenase